MGQEGPRGIDRHEGCSQGGSRRGRSSSGSSGGSSDGSSSGSAGGSADRSSSSGDSASLGFVRQVRALVSQGGRFEQVGVRSRSGPAPGIAAPGIAAPVARAEATDHGQRRRLDHPRGGVRDAVRSQRPFPEGDDRRLGPNRPAPEHQARWPSVCPSRRGAERSSRPRVASASPTSSRAFSRTGRADRPAGRTIRTPRLGPLIQRVPRSAAGGRGARGLRCLWSGRRELAHGLRRSRRASHEFAGWSRRSRS